MNRWRPSEDGTIRRNPSNRWKPTNDGTIRRGSSSGNWSNQPVRPVIRTQGWANVGQPSLAYRIGLFVGKSLLRLGLLAAIAFISILLVRHVKTLLNEGSWGELRYTHVTANIRAERSVKSKIVGQAPPGTELKVDDLQGNFYAVYDPKTKNQDSTARIGYIYASLMKKEPLPQSNWGELRYTHTTVNIRSRRSAKSRKVGKVPPGTALIVDELQGNFYAVYDPKVKKRDATKRIGYIYAPLMKKSPP